jgi:hypothetical protein
LSCMPCRAWNCTIVSQPSLPLVHSLSLVHLNLFTSCQRCCPAGEAGCPGLRAPLRGRQLAHLGRRRGGGRTQAQPRAVMAIISIQQQQQPLHVLLCSHRAQLEGPLCPAQPCQSRAE